MVSKTQFSYMKIANVCQIVLYFSWGNKGRARSAETSYVKWQTKRNCPLWKSAIIAKSSSRAPLLWDDKSRARSAEFVLYKMAYQTQVSSMKICNFRQIVHPIFAWNDQGRARSAEIFSIYNSFSYGLLKTKGARSTETFSKLKSFFSILLKSRPESVCR